ncbi:unnamed protein product [Rhizophagus irregularis]|uniref:Uncharacterized protein n=1 Tax=Rhizophagus irregularis TaxID=588596 RepID=A0A916EC48_9GLOM|nr:unnamed protein product [Rhizophagus irregularis]CAB5370917.1 unnamed protein product [Rhizophagus irregularis]
MIANITTIVYILSVTDETINNSVLQKGMAISRIDNEDAFQIYKFYNYMTLINNTDLDSDDGSEVTSPLKAENVYLITGKFSTTQDGSINVSITTNVQLLIDKEDIPIIKPTVHLLGKTLGYAELTESGYTLQIQNALTKARKNSTVHTTGVFFFAKDQLYCEILEFQSLLLQNQQSDEIHDIETSITNEENEERINEKIEENEERNENIEENEERNENIKKKNNTPKISNSTRGRKKQKTK